jgi:hypothetical protein
MADLIPRARCIVSIEGNWTIWEFRGATVRSQGIHNCLTMLGHPLHDTCHNFPERLELIDRWRDDGDLPAPIFGRRVQRKAERHQLQRLVTIGSLFPHLQTERFGDVEILRLTALDCRKWFGPHSPQSCPQNITET